MSYLLYLRLFAYTSSVVQHILCCVFVLFVFVYVASISGLFIFDCPFGILSSLMFIYTLTCQITLLPSLIQVPDICAVVFHIFLLIESTT